MAKKYPLALILCLSACASYNKEWPSLSAPVPSAEERNIAVIRGKPASTAPEASLPVTIETPEDGEIFFENTQTAIEMVKSSYEKSKAALVSSRSDDDTTASWREAQLLLTRLSQKLSELDPLLLNNNPALSELVTRAKTYADRVEDFVIAERKYLAESEPNL